MDLFWKISKNIIKDISSYSCWISVFTVRLDLNLTCHVLPVSSTILISLQSNGRNSHFSGEPNAIFSFKSDRSVKPAGLGQSRPSTLLLQVFVLRSAY